MMLMLCNAVKPSKSFLFLPFFWVPEERLTSSSASAARGVASSEGSPAQMYGMKATSPRCFSSENFLEIDFGGMLFAGGILSRQRGCLCQRVVSKERERTRNGAAFSSSPWEQGSPPASSST